MPSAFIAAMFLLLAATSAHAQYFDRIPGSKVAYVESPGYWDLFWNQNEVYVGAPSLEILSDGSYVAALSLFGNGTNQNQTKVYRSTDQGQTWTQASSLTGCFHSTVFEHNGSLYMWGCEGSSGDIRIWNSTNGGKSWSGYTTLRAGTFLTTPNTPAIYNNRIWIAVGGDRAMSAPLSSDLMLSSSWTLTAGVSAEEEDSGPLGAIDWQEAQIVASPTTGLAILPNIEGLPNTALIHVTGTTGINFEASAENAFPDLPGGEKKFAVRYDDVSGRFYALTNTVLPAHADDDVLGDKPELIRNTATILTSKNLAHWDVERIFLYTPNIDTSESQLTGKGEGYQYFQFDYDGDDMVLLSRTAMFLGDGQNDPPRGHDSNLCTFHRLEDFRTTGPTQYVKIVDGVVKRYEITLDEHAPLGNFALGTTFDGSALTNPTDVDLGADGYVYIKESGGRILKFDGAGNFITTASSLPGATWDISSMIVEPGRENRTWSKNASATWDDMLDWHYWGRPDTNEEIATFGSAISANRTITMNSNYTVKGLRFLPMSGSATAYTVAGDATTNPTLTLEADSGNATIDVQAGSPRISVNTKLNSNIDATVVSGSALYFTKSVDLNGKTFSCKGHGTTVFQNDFAMNGGKIVTDGLKAVTFQSGGTKTLDGDFEFIPDSSLSLTVGSAFNLIDGQGYLNGRTFQNVYLPELGNLQGWNNDTLYTTDGRVRIVSVTAPEWAADASADWETLTNWKYRARPDSNVEIANLGSAITANRKITMNNSYTLKGLRFQSGDDGNYTVVGSTTTNPTLTLEADSGNVVLDVQMGSHSLKVNTILNSNVDASFSNSSHLKLYNLNLNGKTLSQTGSGGLIFNGALTMEGGTLATDGLSAVTFYASSSGSILDGTFAFLPDFSLFLTTGSWFNLLDGLSNLGGATFDELLLPTLGPELAWDSSTFYTNGVVRIVSVSTPEPIYLPGDADKDGTVDGNDAAILAGNWLKTDASWADGDFNGDGIIDDLDATLLAANWLKCMTQINSSVPEPGTQALLATGLIGLLIYSTRKTLSGEYVLDK